MTVMTEQVLSFMVLPLRLFMQRAVWHTRGLSAV